jgi:syntaxin 18
MVEVRVKREVERSRSILYKARGPATSGLVDGIGVSGGSTNYPSSVELEKDQAQERAAMESSLSPEQIQLFEREQEDMLKHYNSELNKIKYLIPFPLPTAY